MLTVSVSYNILLVMMTQNNVDTIYHEMFLFTHKTTKLVAYNIALMICGFIISVYYLEK